MIEFREATLHDVTNVAQLHAQSWRNAYRGMLRDEFLDGDILSSRLTLWKERLESAKPHQSVFLAIEDDTLLGFSCVFGSADPKWGTLLDNLHIAPAVKGTGLGRNLLHHTSVWVRAHVPGEGLFLWVYEGNALARRFYEKLGAQMHERIIIEAPGGGTVAEFRYAWPEVESLCRATQG